MDGSAVLLKALGEALEGNDATVAAFIKSGVKR